MLVKETLRAHPPKGVTVPCGKRTFDPRGHLDECQACIEQQRHWRAKAWWQFMWTGRGLGVVGEFAKVRRGWA